MKKTVVVPKRNPIRDRAKNVPFETRLYVMFWMQWLTEHVGPKKRHHTDKEGVQAEKWAQRMTKEVLKNHKEWEDAGRPVYMPKGLAQLEVKNSLKELRESQAISQKNFAKAMKLAPANVCRIEQNFKNAQIKTILKYAKALKATKVTMVFEFPKNVKHILPLNINKNNA